MSGQIKFGLIADIHYDLMYRAIDRLEAFINEAHEEKVDFILQLGDFCFPKSANKPFLDMWEKFQGPKYHVLGNHDMDKNDKTMMMDFLGMEDNYYSFTKEHSDFHFIVLDANYIKSDGQYIDYSHGNYFKYPGKAISYIPDQQLAWLREELDSTDKQTIIFSHQSLEGIGGGAQNSKEVRRIIREANKKAGFRKVIASFCGHHHLDGVKVIDNVYFIHMNSSSYIWLGSDYDTTPYTKEIREQYPALKRSVPYRDPLYAMVTLQPNEINIQGKESEFVNSTPSDYGHRSMQAGHEIVPKISDRSLKF